MKTFFFSGILLPMALLISQGTALGQGMGGHSGHGMGVKHSPGPVGKPGDPAKISRTIEITLQDTMRFTPDTLAVKVGETIRFNLKNEGKLLHEWVIGSQEELKEHAEAMRKMPGKIEAEPNMMGLAPGKTGSIVWLFNERGTVTFACLVPGHMEAGMVGTVVVE